VVLADLPRNKVFSSDYDPRTDARPSDLEWAGRLGAERARGKSIIGYFPTWRGNGNDLFLGATTAGEIRELAEYLESRDFVLATKWHTCSFDAYRHQGASRTAGRIDADLSGLPNVVSLPFELDLNTILPECDVLVTDYSSVLFDFALSDRPQIFVAYDLEQYEASVGFFHDYASLVPGQVVRDVKGLVAELEALRRAPADYEALASRKRASLRAEFFEVSESSPRIAAYMEAIDAAGMPRRLAGQRG
jgi:CDP-glycerol glycerophosphotransferase